MRGGQLHHNGVPVQANTIHAALVDFVKFTEQQGKPVLVAHNGQSFDFVILSRRLSEFNMMSTFKNVTSGLLDSLHVFKEVMPKSDFDDGKPCYKLEYLHKKYIGTEFAAHDALADVKAMSDLFKVKPMDNQVIQRLLFCFDIYRCRESLQLLEKDKVISKAMCRKLAKSAISYQHLELAFTRDPENGVAVLFKEPIGQQGLPRISNSKAVIIKVQQHFMSRNIEA